MNARTAYVTHSDCSRHDTGWRHPEHQGRLPAVARAVHRDMVVLHEHLVEVEGVPALPEHLRLAHTAEYVARVEGRCNEAVAAGEVLPLGKGVVVSGASWDAALAAVGCVLTAVEWVEQGNAANAFCAVRPPGHGASASVPGGYGIFNSVAIAARRLREGESGKRVWVVDVGAAPGSGTVSILHDDAAVHLVDVSEQRDEEEPRNVSPERLSAARLPRRSSGRALLEALRSALDRAEDHLVPDFVLFSLGCDALAADPLGSLSLAPRDYYDLTAEIRERAERLCGGRLVSVLEEGYDTEGMGRAVVQHLRALASLPPHED
ncbi:MAG TPA: hypothetical protein VF167_15970 [Longimicrobiaceae bacterium]